MSLAEYRHSTARLADFLARAALADRASSSTRTAACTQARSEARILDHGARGAAGVAGRLNNAPPPGSGWVFARRSASQRTAILTAGSPDAASALVDAERRAAFEEEGAHFESSYSLTFLSAPAEEAARAERWLYEGRERGAGLAHCSAAS
jgi:type IV secretion system protein VirB4